LLDNWLINKKRLIDSRILKIGGSNIMAAKDCIKGLVVGGLIGAALGMLYAPMRGEETREEIAKSFQELREKAKHQLDETCTKMDELASRGKELYNEGKEKVSKALDFCAKEKAAGAS
jgi:gas vesicle protein